MSSEDRFPTPSNPPADLAPADAETNAEAFPARPIRLIAGFPQGGPVDIAGRLAAECLSAQLAVPVTVTNLPAESGNLATRAVVNAEPDGHTILVCGPVHPIADLLFHALDFSFAGGIRPVVALYAVPLVLVIGNHVPIDDAPSFVAHGRARPGGIKVGFAGKATPQHVGIELFRAMAGVDLTLVPYAGSPPALDALMTGEVDAMFDPMPSSLPLIRAGRIKALAVTGSERSRELPSVPAMAEIVPGYTAGSWFGLGVPRATPDVVVERLNAAMRKALALPETAGRIHGLGGTVMDGSAEDFARFVAEEAGRYAEALRRAGLVPADASREAMPSP